MADFVLHIVDGHGTGAGHGVTLLRALICSAYALNDLGRCTLQVRACADRPGRSASSRVGQALTGTGADGGLGRSEGPKGEYDGQHRVEEIGRAHFGESRMICGESRRETLSAMTRHLLLRENESIVLEFISAGSRTDLRPFPMFLSVVHFSGPGSLSADLGEWLNLPKNREYKQLKV